MKVVVSTISNLELILTKGQTIIREIKVTRRSPRRDLLMTETKKILRTINQEKNRSVDVAEAALASEEEEVTLIEEKASENTPEVASPH